MFFSTVPLGPAAKRAGTLFPEVSTVNKAEQTWDNFGALSRMPSRMGNNLRHRFVNYVQARGQRLRRVARSAVSRTSSIEVRFHAIHEGPGQKQKGTRRLARRCPHPDYRH